MTAPSRPWMMFYPSDWRADPKLRCCSIAARGLWVELLALMHESERYGYLLVNGKQPTDRKLAALVGTPVLELSPLLSELEEEGVFSRDRNGVIYSRRMVRDEKRAETARKNGRRGGNPKLCNSKGNGARDNQEDNAPDNPDDKPHIPESRDHIGSVSKDTAAGAADLNDPEGANFDPIKALFDDGVRVLGAAGVKPQRARSVIGMWRSKYGNEAVAIAIAAAESRNISQPLEWIPKRLEARGHQNPNQSRDYADIVIAEHERKTAKAGS